MKLPRRTFLHIAAGASALASLPRIAIGHEAYPSRPIHVIVGFTAGAASDVTARILGDSMRPILGQQIIVEDRPGAGSSIAAEYVAHAAKDGYTLFVATLSIITNQIINPFDLTRDLAPIALLASGAVVLVVNSEINVHSVAELVALAASLDAEQRRAAEEGLSDDELALFDLLFQASISQSDRERLKQASKNLLDSLRDLLKPMPAWTKNSSAGRGPSFHLGHPLSSNAAAAIHRR